MQKSRRMKDVLVLIDRLDETVSESKQGRLNSHVKLDREEAFALLDEIRSTLPDEIKNARWITKERQEMLAEARRECERTLDEARRERDRVLSEEVLANLAEHRAERILESARAREREIRLAAEDYADDILESLELNMEKFVAAVRRGRARLQVP